MKKKILISTGGSGGHVIPAIILHEHLKEKFDVIISTDQRGKKYLGENFLKVNVIDTPKLGNIFMLPFNFLKILLLVIKSIILIKKVKIDKLISTGGYMSFPLLVAAKFFNLKIYLLEPNFLLGRSNKFFLNFSEKIFCYSQKIKNFPKKFEKKVVLIKPLVRKNFYHPSIKKESTDKLKLLIIGGSQGAKFFDDFFKNIILSLSKKYPLKIIQQTSKKNINNLKSFYQKNDVENLIFSYENNFIDIVYKCDFCITRAGASTLSELSILNIPFLAVPLPTAKDNHQFENASYYKEKDCCWIIDQNSSQEEFEKKILEIIRNKEDLLKKRENLKNLNYQNTWINANQKLLDNINEY